jgi:hypothetical protein
MVCVLETFFSKTILNLRLVFEISQNKMFIPWHEEVTITFRF